MKAKIFDSLASILVTILLLLTALTGCGEEEGNTTIKKYTYMMAFHAHEADVTDPSLHMIYLAGSDDGVTWSLIEEWTPLSGSVPDLMFHNGWLWIFHTGTQTMARVNANFQVVEESIVTLNSSEDTAGFVDPCLYRSEEGVFLFYLPGIMGQDPAGCTSYPCTKEIHSALADEGTGLKSFTQVDGDRVSVTFDGSTLFGGMSDPDVVKYTDNQYIAYVSSGSRVWVFTNGSLNGTYTSPDGSSMREVSPNCGGVPSAIVVSNQVWLYVSQEEIRRAVIADGITTPASNDFVTVLTPAISATLPQDGAVSSPSVIVWPDDSWNQ